MSTAPPAGGGRRPVRLHSLLDYGRWTLLLAAARADRATLRGLARACARAAAPVRILLVTLADRAAAGRLGRSGDFRLVRPENVWVRFC